MNWVSPKVQAQVTTEYGRGVFAVEPIAKHERIAVFGGHIVTFDIFDTLPEACQHYCYQIADDLIYAYLDVTELGEDDCFNHSCSPNAGFRGHIELVALNDIATGEEVTFDPKLAQADLKEESEGKVKGKKISATATTEMQGNAMEFVITGSVDGDSMTGTISAPIVPEPLSFTGTQTKNA